MKRNLVWRDNEENLVPSLVSPERLRELDEFVVDLCNKDSTVEHIICELNRRGDLNDSEWTAIMFALGAMYGREAA